MLFHRSRSASARRRHPRSASARSSVYSISDSDSKDDRPEIRVQTPPKSRRISSTRTAAAAGSEPAVSKSPARASTQATAAVAAAGSGFVLGQRVEVNYKGKGKWFPGTVAVAKLDNGVVYYSIEYDDGDREAMVRADCIRALGDHGPKVITEETIIGMCACICNR